MPKSTVGSMVIFFIFSPSFSLAPHPSLGGYLAELTTEEESKLVMSVISDEVNYWIGLTDFADGEFQ